jgi:hypothetical protein
MTQYDPLNHFTILKSNIKKEIGDSCVIRKNNHGRAQLCTVKDDASFIEYVYE